MAGSPSPTSPTGTAGCAPCTGSTAADRRRQPVAVPAVPGSRHAAGLDPIGYAAETIGQALAAQRYGATFFADSAVPSMALLSDQNISSEQAREVRDIWEARTRVAAAPPCSVTG